MILFNNQVQKLNIEIVISKDKKTEMNKFYRIVLAMTLGLLITTEMHAGNPDRSGQAGATQLLINPWPNSSGQGGANMGSIAA